MKKIHFFVYSSVDQTIEQVSEIGCGMSIPEDNKEPINHTPINLLCTLLLCTHYLLCIFVCGFACVSILCTLKATSYHDLPWV